MAVKTLTEIPTLTQLYSHSGLIPSALVAAAAAAEPLRAPSASINARVGLVRGDITRLAVGAIVNAANSSLLGGGGVDGAIHRAAGHQLLAECRSLGGCPPGQARVTRGYRLPAAHVIHTVGPVFTRDPAAAPAVLRSCYRESLACAVCEGVRSVAFSAISTGIYGYPSDEAAAVACETVRDFLESAEGADRLDRVVFVTFEKKDVDAYDEALPKYFPPAQEN